ncbi:GAF domain-containing protein [Spirosoma endbachense]|uniref:GAF domain-containing protein n=1 Tax=Spirosoma endbachense TaxID=2666025 RepID=A0A6P1VYM1_9BACT|nr:GAF domain-containing protein [Spirosoma endbachense]
MSRVASNEKIRQSINHRQSLKNELEAERIINAFAMSLLEQTTVEDVLWDVAKNCIARLNFVDCVIYQLDKERNVLVQQAAHGPKSMPMNVILQPIEIPLGSGIVGAVAESGRAELIGDTSLDKRYIADDAVRYSEITVPIWVNGQVWGVLDAEHPQKNFFMPRHLKILSTVAALCAQKIKQADVEQAYRQAERQLMETKKRVAETKLMALRMQMNPHFIFNSLNSINKFILQNDVDRASDLLTKFSRLIRQVLANSKTEWVSLRNELKVLQIYVELEQLRCDNKFEVKLNVSDDLDQDVLHVPLLITQPYVENAIWHGLLPMKEGVPVLQIDCCKHNNQLIIDIQDNGIGREASGRLRTNSLTAHKSHGITITEERLNLVNEMYGADACITITDQYKAGGAPAGTHVRFTQKLLNQ